jgi:hypothetical protein
VGIDGHIKKEFIKGFKPSVYRTPAAFYRARILQRLQILAGIPQGLPDKHFHGIQNSQALQKLHSGSARALSGLELGLYSLLSSEIPAVFPEEHNQYTYETEGTGKIINISLIK